MGKLVGTLLLCISLHAVAAGDTLLQLQLTKTIAGNYNDFYIDNLQNIYLVTAQNNSIKKLHSNGDSVAVFNNVKRYGKMYSIDVSNPLKVLVFYKDFSTVVLLDRFLAIRATVDLRRLGITQVKAVAMSYDGNIWLYDEGEGKLKKIDEEGKVLVESADLRLVFNEALSPVKIIDNNGQLYVYDNGLGWLIFDYYTAFKKQFAFAGWKDVSAIDNRLMGHDDHHFFTAMQSDVDYQTLQTNISVKDALKVVWQQNRWYILTKVGIYIYQPMQ